MRNEKIIVGGLAFISFYILFWLWFFDTPKSHKILANIPKKQSSFNFAENNNSVLSAQTAETTLPISYTIPIDLRRQFFNLSCEFAAAAGIIFHFTNNPLFAVNNELIAEKTLINKVAVSKNPNVGLRMGDTVNLENLYANLNQGFGGADYYGIHAPPFIDLLKNYSLTAKPIYINESTISSIQKAISSGNLIMAWIKIGYAKPIDDYLSYGKVKIVKGEHAVVINGYDESGVMVMDPGIGLERHIEYASLLDAASFFPIPFLEVAKEINKETVLTSDLIIGFDSTTEIDRSIPKIYLENGAGQTGAANQMRDILKDFGYSVVAVSNADNFDYLDITIQAKKEFSDFLYILKRDIKIATFAVSSSSTNLPANDSRDIVIIVGK